MWTLEDFDYTVDQEMQRHYEGYKIDKYASGFEFSTGRRELLYDVTMKDGSTFVAIARYDTEKHLIDIVERYE